MKAMRMISSDDRSSLLLNRYQNVLVGAVAVGIDDGDGRTHSLLLINDEQVECGQFLLGLPQRWVVDDLTGNQFDLTENHILGGLLVADDDDLADFGN